MGYFLLLQLFPSGQILFTPSIALCGVDPYPLLRRHLAGEWDDQHEYDEQSNIEAVENGGEILSQYNVIDQNGNPIVIAIMTAADRSHTMIYTVPTSDFMENDLDE